MPYVIFDIKGILMPKSCIEQFGIDLTRHNIRNGSTSILRNLYAGVASVFAKECWNGLAYRFAQYAYRGAPKRFVEECSENYRKLMPDRSQRVIRHIRDLGIDVRIITHDIRSLLRGIYDGLEFDLERLK